jgi:hypothetical protein
MEVSLQAFGQGMVESDSISGVVRDSLEARGPFGILYAGRAGKDNMMKRMM